MMGSPRLPGRAIFLCPSELFVATIGSMFDCLSHVQLSNVQHFNISHLPSLAIVLCPLEWFVATTIVPLWQCLFLYHFNISLPSLAMFLCPLEWFVATIIVQLLDYCGNSRTTFKRQNVAKIRVCININIYDDKFCNVTILNVSFLLAHD